MLYRKDFEALHKCLRSGVLGYKVKDDDGDEDHMKNGPFVKILWYLQSYRHLNVFFFQC